MSEAQASKRTKAEVETVRMGDGRDVAFSGKRRMNKDIVTIDGQAAVRFDFRNGESRTFQVSGSGLLVQLACHGAAQKIGDECAGEEDVDDMVVAVDEMIARLNNGEWKAARATSGDSFSGASIVIRAICEATGKSLADVKAFLQKKLDQAEAAGQKLTRRALYDSFRNPASKTGQIIERLEREKRTKTAVDANDLLSELG